MKQLRIDQRALAHILCLITVISTLSLLGCKQDKADASTAKEVPVAPGAKTDSAPQRKWQAAPVKRQTLRQLVPAIGSFYPRRTTKLGPQVSGRVLQMLVDVGTVVKERQKLVTLDPVFFRLEKEQRETDVSLAKARIVMLEQKSKTSESEVANAQIVVDDASLQFDRMKKLWEKPHGETPSVPQKLYDDSNFRYRQAVAGLETAKSRSSETKTQLKEAQFVQQQSENALHYSEQRLKETEIFAPYPAVVTKRLVDPGEAVTSAPVIHLLEVQEVSTLNLEFSLPQPMLSLIREGTLVEFDVEGIAQNRQTSKVEMIFPAVDEATRSFRCRAMVDNRDMKLKPGLMVQLQAVIKEFPNVLTVPRRALSRNDSGAWQVYVERDGQEAISVVKIGFMSDDDVEVQDGLRDGQSVLIPE